MLPGVLSILLGLLAPSAIDADGAGRFGPPFWGNLKPGPYAVGFRSLWQLDYHTLASPGWEEMTKRLLENSSYVNGPLLMVANAKALFQLADSLKHAERYYFTLRDQDHNDFIDQGISDRPSKTRRNPAIATRKALESARAGYESVCAYALDFFNVYLKNQTGATRGAREEVPRHQVWRRPAACRVSAGGCDGPGTLPRRARTSHRHCGKSDSSSPARGVEATLALLKRWREKEPGAPVLQEDFGFALVDECLGHGRIEDAIAINRFYSSHDREVFQDFPETW